MYIIYYLKNNKTKALWLVGQWGGGVRIIWLEGRGEYRTVIKITDCVFLEKPNLTNLT
jgi:hypothetical protein